MGRVDLLDPYGFSAHDQFIIVNEIGKQARKEATYTATKPKTMIFRIINQDNGAEVSYDLTIEKATG